MEGNPSLPAKYVTLKQLKEKRHKEKQEEEERLCKLKEEEEERLCKLKEEEEEEARIRKLKEEEEEDRLLKLEEEEERRRNQQREEEEAKLRNPRGPLKSKKPYSGKWSGNGSTRNISAPGTNLKEEAAVETKSPNIEAKEEGSIVGGGKVLDRDESKKKKKMMKKKKNNRKNSKGNEKEIEEKKPEEILNFKRSEKIEYQPVKELYRKVDIARGGMSRGFSRSMVEYRPIDRAAEIVGNEKVKEEKIAPESGGETYRTVKITENGSAKIVRGKGIGRRVSPRSKAEYRPSYRAAEIGRRVGNRTVDGNVGREEERRERWTAGMNPTVRGFGQFGRGGMSGVSRGGCMVWVRKTAAS